MIKLKTIADLIDKRTDDLTTEFDDSKDIFFKTIEDEYIQILKIDNERSVIIVEDDTGSVIFCELKNNQRDGRLIFLDEYMHYEEYKDGVLHGYSEGADQTFLDSRGFYKNGLQEGWWEYGDKYIECEYYEDRDDFHSLENYRAASFDFYLKGHCIRSFWSLDSEYEYQLAIEKEYQYLDEDSDKKKDESYFDGFAGMWKYWTKSDLDQGEIVKGRFNDYFSYETYLKMTNLPKLKPPSRKPKEQCDHCARSIDYDQILKEFDELQTKHKVSVDSFKIDNIKMYS